MNANDATSVIDLFYRHQFTPASPLIQAQGSAGGYSGARFWKIRDDHATWCLRRWPAEVASQKPRLAWIHHQLASAFAKGLVEVPVPVLANNRETIVEFDNQLWQLEPWMPGRANFHDTPSLTKLIAAVQCLARFHRAVPAQPSLPVPSPGLRQRVQRLGELFQNGQVTDLFLQIESASQKFRCPSSGFSEVALRICMQFRRLAEQGTDQLNRACQVPVETQAVIADIWHDHVLFEAERVSGLIDFARCDWILRRAIWHVCWVAW